MKLKEALDPGLAPDYNPKDAPIRKARTIASQIDDLMVDMMDELLDAKSRYPDNEDLERVIWYFNNDEFSEGFKELKRLRDG